MQVPRDAAGRVLLEFNPACFRALLNALTYDSRHLGSDRVGELVVCPGTLKEHAQDMHDMVGGALAPWW